MNLDWENMDALATYHEWCRIMREEALIEGKFPPGNDQERAIVEQAKGKKCQEQLNKS